MGEEDRKVNTTATDYNKAALVLAIRYEQYIDTKVYKTIGKYKEEHKKETLQDGSLGKV